MKRQRNQATTWAAGLAAIAVLVSSGCGEKEAGGIAPPTNAGAAVVAEPSPPSLAELQAALDLTAEQAASLAPPLRTWERAHEELATRIRNGEGDGSGPEYGLGGAIEPPHFRFLEDATPFLTREQLRRLVQYLEQRREAERRRLMGEGRHPDPGASLARIVNTLRDEFSLSREQLAQIHEAFRAAHDAFRSIHTDYVAGVITAVELRDGTAAALESLTDSLESVLGPDAYARLADLVAQARTVVAQRLLDTLRARTERQVAFLTVTLGLDEDQRAAVAAASETARAGAETLLTEVRDGTIAFPEALYRRIQIHETLRAAIHAALTQEQIDLLSALRPLMRHDPPLPLYFS